MHTSRFVVGAAAIFAAAFLSGCAVGQPAGYAEGVRDAERVIEFGGVEFLAEMQNELNYSGACEGVWANFSNGVPIENRPAYLEGCKDTIRAAATGLG